MELYQERPPDYVSHSPESIKLPAVPQHDFAPSHAQADLKLPGLHAVLSSPDHGSFASHGSPTATSMGNLPPIDAINYVSAAAEKSTESSTFSPLETGSATSMDDPKGRPTGTVSMDDPDVRIAAEALSGLGNPGTWVEPSRIRVFLRFTRRTDFVRSPTNSMHMYSHAGPSHGNHAMMPQEPEPLLNLLTQAHPWVGGTINGSMNAYETTKYYSPRFVRAGVSLVERNIALPMATKVGSVGKMTGVENVARWYLNARRPGEPEHGSEEDLSRSKRRRLEADEMDVEACVGSPRTTMRRDSQESPTELLPAYRASKPPSYREEISPAASPRSRTGQQRPSHNRSWSQQVVLSASGLGVALSDTSRSSLVYCLGLLSRSAEHIATVTEALKIVLEQYDQARDHWHQQREASVEKGPERPKTPDHDESARRLAAVIKKHSDDIWDTLKRVVTLVSNTTGGALPLNARNFVRDQLMSLPHRWRHVSAHLTGDSETSRNAHRMIAFARQGLDMMTEVSQVCQVTLEKAEDWLRMVGRRRPVEARYERSRVEKDEEMVDRDGMDRDESQAATTAAAAE